MSCSNSDQEHASADETPTLRYTASRLYESTLWTEEVELGRLTESVSSVRGISSRLNLSPLIVLASVPDENSAVFPSLASFGSLDTSLIPKSLRSMLTSFSECIAKNSDADSFMAKENLYSLAVFYSDFARIFGACFDFGTEGEKIEKSQNGEETDSSAADSSEPKNSEEVPKEKWYFSSFVLGQPFLDGIFYEIPIKFFSEKATLTVSVFCFEESGGWKVDQVQISDWEIF